MKNRIERIYELRCVLNVKYNKRIKNFDLLGKVEQTAGAVLTFGGIVSMVVGSIQGGTRDPFYLGGALTSSLCFCEMLSPVYFGRKRLAVIEDLDSWMLTFFN